MLQTITPRKLIFPMLLAAIVAFTVLGLGVFGSNAAAGPQHPVVTLVAAGPARAGQSISVKVIVTNVRDLAGFQSAVNFDSARLRLTGVTIEKGIGGNGREVLTLGPARRDGSVVFGAATCPAARCDDPRPERAPRILQGMNGRVELATLSFYTETPGSYDLTLSGVQLVDPQGNALAHLLVNTTLDVTSR